MEQRPKRLLDRVCEAIRLKHSSRRPEESSITWITRDSFFHDKRPPSELGSVAIEALLTHLAVDQKVAASTQHHALSAVLFL